MAYAKTIAGARLKMVINGDFYGVCTGVRWNIATPGRPAIGIDDSSPQEIIPTTYQLQGELDVLRLTSDGGLEGAGLIGFEDELLLQKYNRIQLLDRLSDNIVADFVTSWVDNQRWAAQPRQVLAGSFSFQAIGFINEAR